MRYIPFIEAGGKTLVAVASAEPSASIFLLNDDQFTSVIVTSDGTPVVGEFRQWHRLSLGSLYSLGAFDLQGFDELVQSMSLATAVSECAMSASPPFRSFSNFEIGSMTLEKVVNPHTGKAGRFVIITPNGDSERPFLAFDVSGGRPAYSPTLSVLDLAKPIAIRLGLATEESWAARTAERDLMQSAMNKSLTDD